MAVQKAHKDSESKLRKTEEALKKARDELDAQTWGLKKTNEAIRLLYRELEQKTKALEKLDQLKSDFISAVSHELRTPLSIVKEGISLVLEGIPGDINEKQKKLLTVAKGNIDRLARIINELLDISKIEAGKTELKKGSVNLKSLIKQVVLSFEPKAEAKGIELKTNFPEKEMNVYADADKIIQVFTNLLANALKFTEKGYIEISAAEKKNEVECTITDTGIGMSKSDLPKVFDKFQQFGRATGGGEKGTGLGLSIARGIIELHNGNIWVESKLGKGTKFTFTLPMYTTESLFKQYVSDGIKEAIKKDTRMSLLVVSIVGLDKLKRQLSSDKIKSVLKGLEGVINKNLRQRGDAALKDTGEIAVLLLDCGKEEILAVKDRLQQNAKDYLASRNLAGKIKLRFGYATYPDETNDTEELIRKAKNNE